MYVCVYIYIYVIYHTSNICGLPVDLDGDGMDVLDQDYRPHGQQEDEHAGPWDGRFLMWYQRF